MGFSWPGVFLLGASGRTGRFFTQLLFHNPHPMNFSFKKFHLVITSKIILFFYASYKTSNKNMSIFFFLFIFTSFSDWELVTSVIKLLMGKNIKLFQFEFAQVIVIFGIFSV